MVGLMYTAENARNRDSSKLDSRIQYAVENYRSGAGAHMRVYREDPWCDRIREELEARGFVNIDVPDITMAGDVYFEWSENDGD